VPTGDEVVVVDGVSKRYPRIRYVPLLRTTQSIFGRWRGRHTDASEWIDEDDDDEVVEEEEEQQPQDHPPEDEARDEPDLAETFWALQDVSFGVGPGSAVGLVGGKDAGKTTLLRIIAEQAFPTQGVVRVRGHAAPLAAALLAVMDNGRSVTRTVTGAAALLAVPPSVVAAHIEEISALAGVSPNTIVDRRQDPQGPQRLAVAASVVLPGSVVLLDEMARFDEKFVEGVIAKVRARLAAGDALIVAGRRPDVVRELGADAIWLEYGKVTERGRAEVIATHYQTSIRAQRRTGVRQRPQPFVAGEHIPDGTELRLPPTVASFNNWLALASCVVCDADGNSLTSFAADDDVVVDIRIETGPPGIEVRPAVGFMPSFGKIGVRLELPEPVRFLDAGTYLVRATVPGRTLKPGLYDVRADAVVANPVRGRATVVVRNADRVRVVGEESAEQRELGAPVRLWDATAWAPADAEWTIEQEQARAG
jgi:ABC-type polysaccharide/polyol phosphate transport system ATPase subunit